MRIHLHWGCIVATATLVPDVSEQIEAAQPQHMTALQRANKVRLARAELKRRVKDDKITVGQVVLSTPWEAASMTVADLLMSQHRWGRGRTKKFLSAIPLSETKTVGSLTERQRRAIATALEAPSETRTTAPSREERIETFAAQMQRANEPG